MATTLRSTYFYGNLLKMIKKNQTIRVHYYRHKYIKKKTDVLWQTLTLNFHSKCNIQSLNQCFSKSKGIVTIEL